MRSHTDTQADGLNPATSHLDHRTRRLTARALAAVDLTRWRQLTDSLAPILAAAFAQASQETVEAVGDVLRSGERVDIAVRASTWARDRTAELVGMRWVGGRAIPVVGAEHSLAASSLNMIARLVRAAVDGTSGTLDPEVLETALLGAPAYAPSRAGRVATYELRNAVHAGTLDGFNRSSRVRGSLWRTVGDDRVSEECAANGRASPVLLGQPFASGHIRPPARPGCRCWLEPWLADD